MSTPKILYFGTPIAGLDYLSDTVFHGLRQLLGDSVVDAVKLDYMYNSFPEKEKHTIYGKGFTVPTRLPDIYIDRTDIVHKIISKYFDFIIFGAPYSSDCMELINLVTLHYDSRKIVFINGGDSWPPGQQTPPAINGIHFLRERFENDNTIPLSFSIPKENIISDVPNKRFYLMPLIPNVRKTYVYETEQAYNAMYRDSMFGLTWRKNGWDCMRHYEILSQGCVPLFLDIKNLPASMMIHFPRKQLEEVLDVAIQIENYNKNMNFSYENFVIQDIDFYDIQFKHPESYGYYDIADKLLQYTKTYLTTEYTAKYILDSIKRFQ